MAGFADILAGINSAFTDPSNAGTMGFAQGLLQAGAPHMMTPVSGGQALGMGMQGSQQYQSAALQNAMARLAVPFQQMKVMTFAKAMKTLNDPKATPQQKASARALAANLISPGMGPSMLANDPTIQGAKTTAVQGATPHPVGPGQRLVTGAGAPIVGAQGALPTGTAQNSNGSIAPLPGALPAIAATSGAQAGGSAAATFPFQQALKQTGYFKRSPGEAGAFNAPAPVFPGAQFSPRPGISPQALQAAARQRQMGMVQGLSQAAPNASSQPQPSIPAPQGQPPVPPVPAAPAASGGGLLSPGMTPAQVAMSTGQGKQAVEMNAGYQKQAEDAKETLAQVAELRAAAQDFAPGQFAESRIKGLQWMQSLGLITPKEMQQLGSAQEGQKMTIQLQSTLTRSLGSREAAQVFATLGKGVPNLTLSPDGFAKMTAYMAGMARYNQARAVRSQQAFNAGDIAGVNNVRNQYIANSNPAYFIIASASPATQREMIAQMGPKARSFLQRWQAATVGGYAPTPTAYASQP